MTTRPVRFGVKRPALQITIYFSEIDEKFPLELLVPGGIIKEEKEDNISTNHPKVGFGGCSFCPAGWRGILYG